MAEFDTRAVQIGQRPDPATGAVVPPLTLASTFVMDSVETTRAGYEYSRTSNPTRDSYQLALADLEGGDQAVAFPSGLSAQDTIMRVLTRAGDTVLYGRDGYGGTGRLLAGVLATEGRVARQVDTTDPYAIRTSLAETGATVVWLTRRRSAWSSRYMLTSQAIPAMTATMNANTMRASMMGVLPCGDGF